MGAPDLRSPRTPGDYDHAEDVLDELQELLRKRNMLLIHKPDCIVLARRDILAGPNTWRAIAQVATLSPTEMKWRPVTAASPVWTPGKQ